MQATGTAGGTCRQFVQTPVGILMDSTLSSGVRDFASQLLRWDWGLGCTLTDRQLAEERGNRESPGRRL